ncbi:MAG: DoxX family protein [Microthrixaceae bacterium]
MALVVLALVSGLSFLYYGFRVLFRAESTGEFERFGVPAVRQFVGLMEVLGGTAVILGLVVAPLGAFAAAGLTVLMVLGLIVRVRIHDAPRLMAPAAALGALNAVLAVLFLSQ